MDEATKKTLRHLTASEDLRIDMVHMVHQAGGTDCGVFAIAVATALALAATDV